MTPFDHIRFAGKSDVGRKRKNNEDNFGMFPGIGVWLVADGMGGGDDGEVASAAVVKEVDEFASSHAFPAEKAYAASDVAHGVERAVGKASLWIFNRTREKHLSSCGSKVVGCVVDATKPGQAIAFHAGDSRLYRLRGRGIKQITKDHSAAEMIGVKDEAKVNPMFRGMVLRAVGVRSSVEIELTPFDVKPGDRILICSDGLSRMVPDKKILAISRKTEGVEAAVDGFIAAANAAGGVDNVTAVLIEIGELPPALPLTAFPRETVVDDADAETCIGTADSQTGDTGSSETSMTRMTACAVDADEAVGEAEQEPPEASAAPVSASRRRRWPIFAVGGAVVLLIAIGMLLITSSRRSPANPPQSPELSAKQPAPAVEKPAPKPAPAVEKPAPKPAPAVEKPAPKPAPAAEKPAPNPAPVVEKPAPVVEKPAPKSAPAVPTNALLAVAKGCEELATVCDREKLMAFILAVRRNLPQERVLDFSDQAKRAVASAQAVVRMKNAKTASRFLVDLKYALQSAPEMRAKLATRAELVAAWDAVADGDVENEAARLAAAKLIEEMSKEDR